MGRVVVVLAGKGGCGKSAVAAGVACRLAEAGQRVGLLDLDLCGPSLAHMLGVPLLPVLNSPHGWLPVKPPAFHGRLSLMSVAFLISSSSHPLIWRGPRKHAMILSFLRDVFWSKLDYLIIDTPPGTSDEHLTVVAALKNYCDGAILVTTPAEVSISTLRKELDFCSKQKVQVLGVVENMAGFKCPCCDHVEQIFGGNVGQVEQFTLDRGLDFLGSIPIDLALGEGADTGQMPLDNVALNQIVSRLRSKLEKDSDEDE